MTSIIKVDQIQNVAGGTPTAADLGLNVSGNVLQFKQVTGGNSTTFTSQGVWTAIAGTCSIIPTSISSKIFVQHQANGLAYSNQSLGMRLKRNGTVILSNDRHLGYNNNNDWTPVQWNFQFLDEPATTSQVDYTFEGLRVGGGEVYHNSYNSTANTWTTILIEIAG